MKRLILAFVTFGLLAVSAHATEEAAPSQAAAPQKAQKQSPDADDLEIDPSEPDFTIVNLPTTLRLPRHKLAFRLTHRFNRPLGQGDLGDLAADLFGLDSGANIGLGLRFSPARGKEIGVYRTNDRTIEFSLDQNLVRSAKGPLGVTAFAAVEGRDNFGEDYAPAVGVVVSRRLKTRGAVYATPYWVGNSRLDDSGGVDNNTLLLGLGARVRVFSSVSIVGEFAPRLAGYKGVNPADPTQRAAHYLSFGIESRVGGHSFQLNFSNGFATTPAQLARGSLTGDDWYIGFNLSRKFF